MTEHYQIPARLNKKGKPSIIHWHGLLSGTGRRNRVMVFVILTIVTLALAFTQFGFVGLGPNGAFVAYGVVLLAPIAVAALLLGVWQGTFLGLVAGAVMFLHARFQPLDYFEVSFVTPSTAIILFTITAFFLSLLMAVALRNSPPTGRRIVYMAIVCFVVSGMFSTAFAVNVLLQTILQVATDMALSGATEIDQQMVNVYAISMATQMGDMFLQLLFDAFLMFVACVVIDLSVRKVLSMQGIISLRTKFRGWLLLVVALAFMLTAGFSFVVITEQAKESAQTSMKDECGYLIDQLKAYDERAEGLASFLSADSTSEKSLSDEESDKLKSIFSMEDILSGYDKETDGTIVIFKADADTGDYTVLLSDDSEYAVGTKASEYIGNGFLAEALSADAPQDWGIVQRTYDEHLLVVEDYDMDAAIDDEITMQIVYMYCEKYNDYAILMITPAAKVFATRNATMAWTSLSALVLLLVVFALVSRLLSAIVVRRIDETNGVLGEITDGNLDARVDIRDSREFSSLSDGVNTTVDALKGWIAEAESRMDAELATAKAIQESALPRIFPPYPDILKFDIYATMHAAKKVGGDFYDFFLIGDDAGTEAGKLGFVMADVSGKGVPAALFMMKAKTQLRDYLMSGMEIGEAVENANRQLCDGNDEGMFVTAWVGVLDYATGHVDYVNAGHNPPLLWSFAEPDAEGDASPGASDERSGVGSWSWLTEKSGMPLGLFEGFPYEAFSIECKVGDQFLLYTDGVTEAMSTEGELYGEERLEKLVNADFTYHPRALVEAVRRDVAKHAAGAEQSDDITVLALEVGVPPEVTATIVVPADDAMLPTVNEFIHTELDRRLCPLRAQKQLDIAVEELFVNVCHYAYGGEWNKSDGMVRVSYTYSAEPPSVKVVIADDGVPYDPLAKPDAVTPDDIMEVPIGGLGILMAKNSVDNMTYERVDGSNVVTIEKKW
ncbi:MAG: SpoIIE family protein phosphatase [Eggerthellaceae bacterium]|nr:SpoIIE family protein phosphatase [Eggerthellaceae bacterium]